ncbi:hypothetical protein HUG17_1191 [Dermatophagoides farinae]|uniref:Uncharacterized protein n=1 Tax=Dermatophagoides farinae TaxID=6954 RepID=A0A9D4SKU6_DERFA|nr:hypothetical protein HUG17_1191 [Dermatophagoides farinae]
MGCDPLSPDSQKKARKIIHEIKELDQFSFPRPSNGQQLTLTAPNQISIKPRKDCKGASWRVVGRRRHEQISVSCGRPFVQHKIKISDIRHIRGEINPADAFTRGVTVDELKKLHRLNYHDIIELQDVVVGVGLTVNGSSEKYDISKFDLDSKRPYNQWIELVQQQSDDWKKSIDETMNELTILIKINQRRFLDDHFDKHIPTFCDDQGLVRCLTRLENSDLSYDENTRLLCRHVNLR